MRLWDDPALFLLCSQHHAATVLASVNSCSLTLYTAVLSKPTQSPEGNTTAHSIESRHFHCRALAAETPTTGLQWSQMVTWGPFIARCLQGGIQRQGGAVAGNQINFPSLNAVVKLNQLLFLLFSSLRFEIIYSEVNK